METPEVDSSVSGRRLRPSSMNVVAAAMGGVEAMRSGEGTRTWGRRRHSAPQGGAGQGLTAGRGQGQRGRGLQSGTFQRRAAAGGAAPTAPSGQSWEEART